MKIPSRFNLFGHTIQVTWHDDLFIRSSNVGEAHYGFNEIKLDTMDGKPESYKSQVFAHELLHIIFNQMGECDLRDNEKFIDIFSSLLVQAIDSMEYE
jgi:hypothetical protein